MAKNKIDPSSKEVVYFRFYWLNGEKREQRKIEIEKKIARAAIFFRYKKSGGGIKKLITD